MSEENKQNPEDQELSKSSEAPDQPGLESGEIIEVEWEELTQIIQIREELLKLETHLSRVLLEHEKVKRQILSRTELLQNAMYEQGAHVRSLKNIDPSLVYELKLPEAQGGKGYFVRKDAESS